MTAQTLPEGTRFIPPQPAESLPTMYDLPSEDPEEPGLPDEFHYYQPQLLRETFLSPVYSQQNVFIGADINLYYDAEHTHWYKRPDWFVVLGASRLYEERELRLSYVVWQETIAPYMVVELLSPGTEKEDLGQSLRSIDQPPSKWQVYEQILKIPYYTVFSRSSGELRVFGRISGSYQELALPEQRLWLPEAKLGLGLWQGEFQGIRGPWLRWYDEQDQWILSQQERLHSQQEQLHSQQEQLQQVQQQAEQERLRAEKLAAKLKELGIDSGEEKR